MAHEGKKRVKLPQKSKRKTILPDSVETWIDYVNSVHDDGLAERKRYEFQWIINLSYYLGLQNLVFNRRTGQFVINDDDFTPLTINRIGAFVESRHAKINKNRPTPRVIPDTNDLDDRRAAKLADQTLLHLWRKIEMEEEYDHLTQQMLVLGSSFMKTVWDPLAGDEIDGSLIKKLKLTKNQDLVLDNEGFPEEDKIFLGEVCSKHLSPFQVIPANFNTTSIKDQSYIVERHHITEQQALRLFPHLSGSIRSESQEAIKTEFEKMLDRLASPFFSQKGSGDERSDPLKKIVLMKIMWMKPNNVFNGGVLAIVIGDQMAMLDEFPHDYGKNIYPVVRFVEKNDGFHFFQQSTVERLIPIQKHYNKIKQQKSKNATLMANIKWLNPKGSQVSEDSLTDEEGEVIDYNPAVGQPKPAQIAPMPNYVTELARELIVDFRDVSGQRESSVSPPPNITAGVAIEVAAAVADEVIQPISKRLSRSMSLVAQQQLILMSEEYNEQRKIKIIGEGDKSQVVWLSGLDLKHQTDVHIEVESLLPEFRGSKRQTLIDLWDRRIIQDPTKLLKAFRHGNFDDLLEEEERLEDRIHIDIAAIKQGKQPEINQFQNHMLYVRELSKFVQTPEFLNMEPDRKQIAIDTLTAHLSLLTPQLPGGGEAQAQQNQASVSAGAQGQIVPPGVQ